MEFQGLSAQLEVPFNYSCSLNWLIYNRAPTQRTICTGGCTPLRSKHALLSPIWASPKNSLIEHQPALLINMHIQASTSGIQLKLKIPSLSISTKIWKLQHLQRRLVFQHLPALHQSLLNVCPHPAPPVVEAHHPHLQRACVHVCVCLCVCALFHCRHLP